MKIPTSEVGLVSDLPSEAPSASEGGSKTRPTSNLRRPALVLTAFLFALTAPLTLPAQPALAPGEVQVERVMLPDARAGSFAFGLPGGVNFCYDPTRGGVNYAWTGDFIDLTNVRPVNKLIKPATLRGPIVYRETGSSPLRRGDASREPVVEFKGYTLRPASVEIRYTVDGAPVTEEISALASSTGLKRTFRFDRSGADAKWFYVVAGRPAAPLARTAAGTFNLDVPFGQPTP